ELFDDELNLDSALRGEASVPATEWSGLDHLEGKAVTIVADGVSIGEKTVSVGKITLDEPAITVEIGLPYTHVVEPLPPAAAGDGVMVRKIRMVEAIFRVQETQALCLDVGRGLKDIALRHIGENDILDAPPPAVSGDIHVRALGWQTELADPLWRIEQNVPLPFTLLSVMTELKLSD
ncbi:MAG: hypothetical protein DI626_01990, partial [Micavibrio aeruginosavorus]